MLLAVGPQPPVAKAWTSHGFAAALILGLDFSGQSLGQRCRMLARRDYFPKQKIDFGDPQFLS